MLTITNTSQSLNGTDAVILDLSGRTISRFTLNATQTIATNNWVAGIYLLRFVDGQIVKIEKQ